MVIKLLQKRDKTIKPNFLGDVNQLNLFGEKMPVTRFNQTNAGHSFAALMHNLLGGELENLYSKNFSELVGSKAHPDIYIPEKFHDGPRTLVECKLSTPNSCINIKNDQMIGYLNFHADEIAKGEKAEVYWAFARYNPSKKMRYASFGDILSHIASNITGTVILPQHLLLHHSISGVTGVQDGWYENGLRTSTLSKLLKGDKKFISSEYENLEYRLGMEEMLIPNLSENLEISKMDFGGGKQIKYGKKKFSVTNFPITLIQDKKPEIYSNFLSFNIKSLTNLIKTRDVEFEENLKKEKDYNIEVPF